MSEIRGPILLYDGTCGFCARSVEFVLRREGARRDLRFARLEGLIAAELMSRRPELKSKDSVIWYERSGNGQPKRVLTRYAAALRVAEYIGGFWAVVAAVGRLVPRAIGNAGYDFVARHRHRIAGRDRCVIPIAEQRARFLDLE